MKEVLVWSKFIRIWHWLLVFNIILLLLSAEFEVQNLHAGAGIFTVVLSLIRIIYGFYDKGYASFSNFVKGPKEVIEFAKKTLRKTEEDYIGHNPLAGYIMVYIMFAVIVTAVFGISVFLIEKEIFSSINSVQNIEEINKILSKIHKAISISIFAAAILHIMGLIRHILVKKENIVKSMINGKKQIK
ncbi:MAG: cytochrome b/b6 domain-containing protein [Spirochaetia bacterium]|nr:cytochrome b/b6 domain-containing protein [Spirochaetia bacterium]